MDGDRVGALQRSSTTYLADFAELSAPYLRSLCPGPAARLPPTSFGFVVWLFRGIEESWAEGLRRRRGLWWQKPLAAASSLAAAVSIKRDRSNRTGVAEGREIGGADGDPSVPGTEELEPEAVGRAGRLLLNRQSLPRFSVARLAVCGTSCGDEGRACGRSLLTATPPAERAGIAWRKLMSGADGDYYAGQDKIEPEAVETERTRTGPDYGGGALRDASVTWQEAVPGILVSRQSADAGSTSKQPERALEGVSGEPLKKGSTAVREPVAVALSPLSWLSASVHTFWISVMISSPQQTTSEGPCLDGGSSGRGLFEEIYFTINDYQEPVVALGWYEDDTQALLVLFSPHRR
uniref:Uncharacterized protein n=1 Tax=Sphaerodactylus townsendi TaxID=933632 RepID=A0ACB8G6S0_9SAUR